MEGDLMKSKSCLLDDYQNENEDYHLLNNNNYNNKDILFAPKRK